MTPSSAPAGAVVPYQNQLRIGSMSPPFATHYMHIMAMFVLGWFDRYNHRRPTVLLIVTWWLLLLRPPYYSTSCHQAHALSLRLLPFCISITESEPTARRLLWDPGIRGTSNNNNNNNIETHVADAVNPSSRQSKYSSRCPLTTLLPIPSLFHYSHPILSRPTVPNIQ